MNLVFFEGSITTNTVNRWFKELREDNFKLEDSPGEKPSAKVNNKELRATVKANSLEAFGW